jgi:hypothetical protein
LIIGAVVFGCLDGYQFPALFTFPMNFDHGTALLGRPLERLFGAGAVPAQ